MKMTYDRQADAFYAYLAPEHTPVGRRNGGKTVEATNSILLDFDVGGRLCGVEVLSASRQIHAETLAAAEDITNREWRPR